MYVCENCGQESAKWMGRCPSCGQWNTFKEFRVGPAPSSKRGAALSPTGGTGRGAVPLSDIKAEEEPRMDLRDGELNRVLGGGLVPGSLVLLGGEPGIGKSTLVLQTILRLTDKKVLYVSGEESARQLKLRADRLSPAHQPEADLLVVCDTSLERIFEHIEAERPDLVIIDSIQTIASEAVESSPGSLSQIRECAAALLKYVKHNPPLHVNTDKCKSCKRCLKVGCPAIAFQDGKAMIDRTQCVGCTVCAQVCPFDAIYKEEK